jgi:hypothetical protein
MWLRRERGYDEQGLVGRETDVTTWKDGTLLVLVAGSLGHGSMTLGGCKFWHA